MITPEQLHEAQLLHGEILLNTINEVLREYGHRRAADELSQLLELAMNVVTAEDWQIFDAIAQLEEFLR